MADADLIQLYSKRILALAAEIPLATPLNAPMGAAKKRSPLCGSTVTATVDVEDGRIAGFGQDVRACALGQDLYEDRRIDECRDLPTPNERLDCERDARDDAAGFPRG